MCWRIHYICSPLGEQMSHVFCVLIIYSCCQKHKDWSKLSWSGIRVTYTNRIYSTTLQIWFVHQRFHDTDPFPSLQPSEDNIVWPFNLHKTESVQGWWDCIEFGPYNGNVTSVGNLKKCNSILFCLRFYIFCLRFYIVLS